MGGRRLAVGMVRDAIRMSLVVGTFLVVINQGATIVEGPIRPGLLLRIGVTYAVPFFVSLYAMAHARA